MSELTPLDRVSAAIAAFSDDALDDAIRALGEGEHLAGLAQALGAKKPSVLAHPTPRDLVRPRIYSGPAGRRVLAALSIAGPCSDDCIETLGDAADEPTRDDMNAVLDGVVQRWGAQMVTLMLTAYPAMEAPCGDVFLEILDSDERFAIGEDAFAAVQTALVAKAAATSGPILDEAGLDRARRVRDARIAQEAARRKKRKK